MTDNKPTPSELLLDQPERRSRSERTIGLFTNTSYSHASLGTLAMAILSKNLDDRGIHDLSKELLEVERSQDLGTFIRCVQARMQGNLTNVMYKAYDLDKYDGRIMDHRTNHVTAGNVIVTMDEGAKEINVSLLKHLIREAVRVITPHRLPSNFNIDQVKWLRYDSDTRNTKSHSKSVRTVDIINTFETEVKRGTLSVTFTSKTITFRNRDDIITYKKPHVG